MSVVLAPQAAHSEAESIKLQDALIKEEEEAERMEDQRQAARMAVERERKARKKVCDHSSLLVPERRAGTRSDEGIWAPALVTETHMC